MAIYNIGGSTDDPAYKESDQLPVEAYKDPTSFMSAWQNRDLGLTGSLVNFVANKINPGQLIAQGHAAQRAKDMNAGELVDKIPKEGIGENQLNSMIQENSDDKKRATLASMASSRVGNFFGNLASGFADPIGAAATFIPFVGEARYTAILGSMGGEAAGFGARLAAKGIVGAAQGALATAALEPANYYLSKQLGKDYSYTDSLENIAFGTIMGGGLHMATYGLSQGISKTLSGFSDGERADVMHTAVANLIEDKPVDVQPAVEGYVAQHTNEVSVEGGHQAEDLTQLGNEKKAELAQTGIEKPGTEFSNPNLVQDGNAKLSQIPRTGELETAKAEAADAMNEFKEKSEYLGVENDKGVKSAGEDIKNLSFREKALRMLTVCAQRGEG